ncbi:MAG: GTPase, partial [Clostridia bacterium]
MDIQWFPGHMTKAYRMMEKEIKLVDSLIYLLDARCIEACFNPKFDALIGNKPVLYVINKADLCEEKDIADWIKEFKNRGKNVIFCNSTASKDRKKIIENLKKINLPTIERYKLKGVNKVVRAMVVGVPNSGKSTLVNCLCGYKKTATGNIAGITRGKQWVTLENNIEILDTPGTLWG